MAEQEHDLVGVLRAVTDRFSAIRDIHELAAAVEREMERFAEVEYTAFYLYDEERGRLSLVRARGLDEAERLQAERTAWDRHPGWVVRHRSALDIPDTSQDERSSDSLRSIVVRSRLYHPVVHGDRCFGAVGLGSSRVGAFTDRHRTMLALVCSIAGIAYENILYTQKIRELTENRYRTLVESANDGFAAIDADGRLTFANRILLDTLGYAADQLIGRQLWQFVSAGSVDRAMQAFWEGRKGTDARNVELLLAKKDGTTVPFEVNMVPLWEEGRYAGGFAVLRDITERKKAEQALRESERHIRDTQRIEAIGRLAGGVAHDFNNLLTLIIGHCDLAAARLPEDEPVLADITQIKKAGERAAALTARLLAFSRKQTLRLQAVDLNAVVKDVSSMLKRLIGEDIRLEVSLAPELKKTLADPTYIGQAVMNLAVNARDAMPAGGQITIKTDNVVLGEDVTAAFPEARPGAYVCVAVADDGVGMDDATLKRLFEPFFTTKKKGEGTGLGLSMVYGTVKQHRGWVDVESEPGKGSRFRCFLPVWDLAAAPQAAGPRPEVSVQLSGNGERILVVEDEHALREFAERVLGAHGYAVLTARSLEEARVVFERERGAFHLVFSDVVLPDGSGVDLVAELMKRRPSIRALMSSGYADERSQRKLIAEMDLPFLRKPYGVAGLLEAVQAAVEGLRR